MNVKPYWLKQKLWEHKFPETVPCIFIRVLGELRVENGVFRQSRVPMVNNVWFYGVHKTIVYGHSWFTLSLDEEDDSGYVLRSNEIAIRYFTETAGEKSAFGIFVSSESQKKGLMLDSVPIVGDSAGKYGRWQDSIASGIDEH